MYLLAATSGVKLQVINHKAPKAQVDISKKNVDLFQRQICDVNCCCDKDCSPEKRAVFSKCESERNVHLDKSYCKYMDYIYKNNTAFQWERDQDGLFCIVKSNLPPSYYKRKTQVFRQLPGCTIQLTINTRPVFWVGSLISENEFARRCETATG